MAVLLALPAYGSATLKGHLVRNRIGGAPVAGAAVVAEGASPTTSTSLGAFTLEFPNKKAGRPRQADRQHCGHDGGELGSTRRGVAG